MGQWQDATVTVATGVITLGSGPDAVRVLNERFLIGSNAQVGHGVLIAMGQGAGAAPGMEFDVAANSQFLAVLDDF